MRYKGEAICLVLCYTLNEKNYIIHTLKEMPLIIHKSMGQDTGGSKEKIIPALYGRDYLYKKVWWIFYFLSVSFFTMVRPSATILTR